MVSFSETLFRVVQETISAMNSILGTVSPISFLIVLKAICFREILDIGSVFNFPN